MVDGFHLTRDEIVTVHLGLRKHWKRLVEFVKFQEPSGRRTTGGPGSRNESLIKLGAPNTLNKSILSTNCIENSFANLRLLIDRVTRWREGCEMAHYWTGSGLWLAEKGFRKIRGHDHLREMFEKLRGKYSADKEIRHEKRLGQRCDRVLVSTESRKHTKNNITITDS